MSTKSTVYTLAQGLCFMGTRRGTGSVGSWATLSSNESVAH